MIDRGAVNAPKHLEPMRRTMRTAAATAAIVTCLHWHHSLLTRSQPLVNIDYHTSNVYTRCLVTLKFLSCWVQHPL